MNKSEALLSSPCVGVCELDAATGWCIGCGRSGEELFGWGELPPGRQRAVWAELPARMARLRRPVRVLPWGGTALLERLAAATTMPESVWSLGVRGASAEFLADARADIAVAVSDRELFARHPGGALVLRATAGLRAFIAAGERDAEVVLALHKARLKQPLPRVLTDLGEDRQARTAGGRGGRLFDLGLGCRAHRFCVRTAAPELVAALRAELGRAFLATDLAAQLVTASPERVVLAAVGRLEVSAPIAPPDGATPAGPHTHLYLDELRAPVRRELGAAVPPDYVPAARLFTTTAVLREAGLELPAPGALVN